jgi:hypothetical protein
VWSHDHILILRAFFVIAVGKKKGPLRCLEELLLPVEEGAGSLKSKRSQSPLLRGSASKGLDR